jgi:pimeloyl-ACP methyl ester carboxylesterase
MATFALIHGGGSSAWDWHLVTPLLQAAGHSVAAVDLPIEDVDAGLDDYVGSVVEAVGTRKQVVVVGHSLGGFTAPLVCDAVGAAGLVYLTAMIPLPGETFSDWWKNTGHDTEQVSSSPEVFFTGVPDELAREASEHERRQEGAWMSEPWPGRQQPHLPTRALLCLDDEFFPAAFMRRQVQERLGAEPVEIPGGHYAPIGNPGDVADALIDFADELFGTS